MGRWGRARARTRPDVVLHTPGARRSSSASTTPKNVEIHVIGSRYLSDYEARPAGLGKTRTRMMSSALHRRLESPP